jgi:Xaa-Pro dipeptidase
VDEVLYTDALETFFPPGSTLLLVHGRNTDSGALSTPAALPAARAALAVDSSSLLYDVLSELRAVKSEAELALMAHVNRVTCLAHAWVMRETRPGMKEFQQESLFAHFGYFCGQCRHTSYTSICGSGENAAVLHYGHAAAPNAKTLAEGDMCLLDMGAELRFYGSDVTCSFPAGGRFSPDQRLVYQTVLDAQWAVLRLLKPGV